MMDIFYCQGLGERMELPDDSFRDLVHNSSDRIRFWGIRIAEISADGMRMSYLLKLKTEKNPPAEKFEMEKRISENIDPTHKVTRSPINSEALTYLGEVSERLCQEFFVLTEAFGRWKENGKSILKALQSHCLSVLIMPPTEVPPLKCAAFFN